MRPQNPDDFGRTITATDTPRRTDDLTPEASELIGHTCEWESQWEITPEDDEYRENKFAGQWAWLSTGNETFGGWVPSEDLTVI